MIRLLRTLSAVPVVAAASIAACPPTALAGTVRAAFVEQANPSKPYNTLVNLSGGTLTVASANGTLGITSLSLSNSADTVGSVGLYVPRLANAGAGCTIDNAVAEDSLLAIYWVQPKSTLHVVFPTPFVIAPMGKGSCLLLGGGGNTLVQMMINGIVN